MLRVYFFIHLRRHAVDLLMESPHTQRLPEHLARNGRKTTMMFFSERLFAFSKCKTEKPLLTFKVIYDVSHSLRLSPYSRRLGEALPRCLAWMQSHKLTPSDPKKKIRGGLVAGVAGLFDVLKFFFNPLTVKVKFVSITHLKKVAVHLK